MYSKIISERYYEEDIKKMQDDERQVETQVRYEISTVEDFAKVPAKRVGHCLAEFMVALKAHNLTSEIYSDVSKQINKKAKDRLKFNRFVWIDDGKGNIEINIKGSGGQLDTPKVRVVVVKDLEDFWGADLCDTDQEIIDMLQEDRKAFLKDARYIVERKSA